MAEYEISVGTELLPGLLNGQDGLAKLVETVLNQILEAQVTEALGAARHERTDDRVGYRNGYRARTLYTRVGPVTLLVPQTRDGSFSTDIYPALPAKRAGLCPSAHGNGRARRLHAQGLGDHRRTVRRQLLQVDGKRTVRLAEPPGQRLQRTAAGRRVPLRAGRCPVHQASARRSRGLACRADYSSAFAPMATGRFWACGSATPRASPP